MFRSMNPFLQLTVLIIDINQICPFITNGYPIFHISHKEDLKAQFLIVCI